MKKNQLEISSHGDTEAQRKKKSWEMKRLGDVCEFVRGPFGGIYPGDLSYIPFKQKLSGYKTTKGAIQFPLDKPIDYELIAEITRFRVMVVLGSQQITRKKKIN